MASVYLETTIPSYLVARPTRDLVVSAHQQITREWWDTERERFDLFISEAVLREIRAGDPDAISRREQAVKGIPILGLTPDVTDLAGTYQKELGLPPEAGPDVVHIAFAVSYELDYLLTWNCGHIANGEVIRRLREANERLGRRVPVLLTPEELVRLPEGGST